MPTSVSVPSTQQQPTPPTNYNELEIRLGALAPHIEAEAQEVCRIAAEAKDGITQMGDYVIRIEKAEAMKDACLSTLTLLFPSNGA